MSEKIRLECEIIVKVPVVIDEELYERWDAGESGAQNEVDLAIAEAGRSALEMEDGDNAAVKQVVLVEDDGYLGTDISVIKRF